MYGIKIGKTPGPTTAAPAWPEEYRRLDVLLQPVADQLRPLWWATGDAVYAFPPEWTLDGKGTKNNTDLSRSDIALIRDVYT